MCEQNADGLLKRGEFLEDRRGLDQLPVRLRLLHLEKDGGGGSVERYGPSGGLVITDIRKRECQRSLVSVVSA